MKINEVISEAKVTKRTKHQDDPSQGAVRLRDKGGYDRTYHMNRIMMAAACADGKSTKAVDSPAETWFEKYNTAHPYTKEEENMLKSAMKTVPTDGKFVSKWGKSKEHDDTHRVSPTPAKKRNKYGV